MDQMAPPNGDVKQIRVKLATGKEWPYPVEVIKTMLESMSGENPAFVGRHLQGALMGDMPASRGRRSNSHS